MNKVMVLLLITWSKSRYGGVFMPSVAPTTTRRGGTPAEKEEAQERKEFVNHI